MKKILPIIIVLILVIGGVWYWKKGGNFPIDSTTATYRNSSLGISFKYPKILMASTTGEEVTLHHEVTFTHHDYCDFKGEGDTTVPTLTDFHVKFHIVNKSLVEAMKSESPYVPAENFVNGEIVPSPGFIDPVQFGNLKGYSIFEGAEGCGHTIYYLSVSTNKTLIVTNDLITVFTGAIDVENQSKAESVPGVLNKAKAEAIFEAILNTVKID